MCLMKTCGFVSALAFLLAYVPSTQSKAVWGGTQHLPVHSSTKRTNSADTSAWNWAHRGDVRAVVTLSQKTLDLASGGPVHVNLVWRRRDQNPQAKRVLVTDAEDVILPNVSTPFLRQHNGTVTFIPTSPYPAIYYIYYLPYTLTGEGAWLSFAWDSPLKTPGGVESTTAVEVPQEDVFLEARTEFESFAPMGLPASQLEVSSLLSHYRTSPFLVFPEHREYPARMRDSLPFRWVQAGPSPFFSPSVVRGEFFTFQLGVYVPLTRSALVNVTLEVDSQEPAWSGATCFNLGGVDSRGVPLVKNVTVAPGGVTSLWLGLPIPPAATPGSNLSAVLRVGSDSSRYTVDVLVILSVSDAPAVTDSGDSTLSHQARLRWLDSTLSLDHDIVAPYTPITVGAVEEEDTSACERPASFVASILNRDLYIGSNGLPACVRVTRPVSTHGVLPSRVTELLSGAMQVVVIGEDGVALPLAASQDPVLQQPGPGTLKWQASLAGGGAAVNVSVTLGMEGYLDVELSVVSQGAPLPVRDVRLEVPLAPQSGLRYMGMSVPSAVLSAPPVGGAARSSRRRSKVGMRGASDEDIQSPPPVLAWRWDAALPNNQIWIGSDRAGLKLHLKGSGLVDGEDAWDSPLFKFTEDQIPPSWGNEGKGGCNLTAMPTATDSTSPPGALLSPFSGPLTLPAAHAPPLTFTFDMSVTPFKTPNQTQHWGLRHFQVGYPTPKFFTVDEVEATGATVVNIHQAVDTMIDPYINYPFIPESVELMRNYTADANSRGMRVKFYYTVRELTNHAAEIWPLRMLDGEVYAEPKCSDGGSTDACPGAAWLRQHVGSNYSPGWACPLQNGEYDAALQQAGLGGRWLNYYVEGLRQSVESAPFINGVYYDGILFGRRTMLRVRKTLDRYSHVEGGGLIDFHTGNNFPYSGSVDAVTYSNHWAFVDSLWIGEGYDYNSDPDYWLIRMSGLPFGMFSDMLGGGNMWRGMLWGSTGRFDCFNATPIWRYWDQWGMADSDMVGWWQDEAPVLVQHSGTGRILATSYVVPGQRTLVAVASWAPKSEQVTLDVNWTALGLVGSRVAAFTTHAIPEYQNYSTWPASQPFTVEPGRGFLIHISDSSPLIDVVYYQSDVGEEQ